MVMRANSDYLMRVTLKNPAIRLALGRFDELTTEGIIRHDADPVAGRLFAGGLASAALMTVLLDDQRQGRRPGARTGAQSACDDRGGFGGDGLRR